MSIVRYKKIIIEIRDLDEKGRPTGPSTYITADGYINGLDIDGIEIIWIKDRDGKAYRITKGLDIP